ncbi:MAG: GNAT family N-acetyltransferase [Alphaproteobacteria bacterium]|nr:GNAT family N-acetyltransferase [Alphaproteobacteria bacterium]
MVFDTPGIDLLEGRRDLAVIWDIRVAPGWRRCGVGSDLFAAAERWARARDCTEVKVETQNINVAACRFYEKQGCELRAANRGVYPTLRDEVQLLWYKEL